MTTANVQVERDIRFLDQSLSPGLYVTVQVRDNGSGIPPDVQSKIFEPFFTTKVAAKGTGIGLPAVKHTVKSLNGIVTVESQVGQGTAFTVYLPAAESIDGNDFSTQQSTE